MSKSRKIISTKWIEFLVNNNRTAPENEKIFFNILFLDLEKLDSKFFGEDKTGNNKYNRFYKTTITGPLKYFFKKYNTITIKEIYHDNSDDKKSHEYFDWHTPYILNEKRNITVKKDKITFIDSDHKKYNIHDENYINSTLIQFIDLILGCTSHAIFRESADAEKLKLYHVYYPLLSRIWNIPKIKTAVLTILDPNKYLYFQKIKFLIITIYLVKFIENLVNFIKISN